MSHFLEALKKLATPEGATLIEAMQADEREAQAEFDRKVAEQRARFEQRREESDRRMDELLRR